MIIVDPRDPADARPRKVPSPSRSPSKHNESGLPKISQPDIAIHGRVNGWSPKRESKR